MTVRILDLCAGTGSVKRSLQAMRRRGAIGDFEYVSVDLEPKFRPTIVGDVRSDRVAQEVAAMGPYDLVWASPPCTEYSRAKTKGVRRLDLADSIVHACLLLIIRERPERWYVENPGTGLLRHRPVMQGVEPFRHTCSYCRYSTPYKKTTDIWTNVRIEPELLRCSAATPCVHVRRLGRHPSLAQAGTSVYSDGNKTYGVAAKVSYKVPTRLLTRLLAADALPGSPPPAPGPGFTPRSRPAAGGSG